MAGFYRKIAERFRRIYIVATRWVKQRPALARCLEIAGQAGKGWLQHGVPRLSAALAFFTAISLAPFLTMLVSLIGLVYGEEAARGHLVEEIEMLTDRQAAAFIQTMIADASDTGRSIAAGIISLAVLVWGCTRLFFQMQESLNVIWGARESDGRALVKAARQRLVAFSMTIVVAFLLLVSLMLSAALSYVSDSVRITLPGSDWIWFLANQATSFLMIWGLFVAIYTFLPEAKVPFRKAALGALVAALLFTLSKEFMGLYLGKQDSVQGAAGALMGVLIWVYFSAQIFYFGAEVTRAATHLESMGGTEAEKRGSVTAHDTNEKNNEV